MSAIEDLFNSKLPPNVLDNIERQASTLLRSGLTHFRHPEHQSGMVLPEDGSVELRAGKSPYPASVTLNTQGTIQICAPDSASIVGKVMLSGNPFDGISYVYDTVQLNPDLKTFPLYTLTAEQALLNIATYPDPNQKEPTLVPLGLLLTPLYLFWPKDMPSPLTQS